MVSVTPVASAGWAVVGARAIRRGRPSWGRGAGPGAVVRAAPATARIAGPVGFPLVAAPGRPGSGRPERRSATPRTSAPYAPAYAPLRHPTPARRRPNAGPQGTWWRSPRRSRASRPGSVMSDTSPRPDALPGPGRSPDPPTPVRSAPRSWPNSAASRGAWGRARGGEAYGRTGVREAAPAARRERAEGGDPAAREGPGITGRGAVPCGRLRAVPPGARAATGRPWPRRPPHAVPASGRAACPRPGAKRLGAVRAPAPAPASAPAPALRATVAGRCPGAGRPACDRSPHRPPHHRRVRAAVARRRPAPSGSARHRAPPTGRQPPRPPEPDRAHPRPRPPPDLPPHPPGAPHTSVSRARDPDKVDRGRARADSASWQEREAAG